ncbi:hypothetical protein ACFZCT_18690 [Streptomyces qaidamensis]|uniref:hypothetical protein n=1 Tax=Streptomyces qaidamensis TaxID=1783515 RepID=UPI0036E903D9
MVIPLPQHHIDGAEGEFPQLRLVGDTTGQQLAEALTDFLIGTGAEPEPVRHID